mmetsp:Transcript_24224/g.45066  ORF Transcript_24224/g.45066 Transcript_24224/m.45066 type:complete len:97 (-) Transcript_24224:905-1195(-)
MVCTEVFGWTAPYITGEDTQLDVMRLLLVVDYWGYTKGLARSTVSQYISSTKTHYIQQEVFGLKPAAVWQEKGKHHPLLSAALNAKVYLLNTSRRS